MRARKTFLMNLTGTIEDIDISNVSPAAYILRTGEINTDDLVDSINQFGLLHPIVVRSVDNHFEIVAGNRRYVACRKLGWRKISCHIVELDDKCAFEVSLIENLQRNTLSPIEEANAFRKYISEVGWGGITDLARNISRSSSYVSKRIRLLDLPLDVLELISYSDIYPSVAEELLSVKGMERQSELAIMIQENDLSLKDTRNLMRRCLNLDTTSTEVETGPTGLFNGYDDHDIRKYFDKLIISLKIVLGDVAFLAQEAENNWILREILMQHRNMISAQIDLLIRQKKRSTGRTFSRLRI
jgi:ParB family chromosome partitioning protein